MIARFTGTTLGLFAFGLATISGLVAGNPAETVLSRALWSLVVFFLIGLGVGAAAQAIVNEHDAKRAAELLRPDDTIADVPASSDAAGAAPAVSAGGQ